MVKTDASTPSDSWCRAQAKERYHDEGFIEIDDNAPVSRGEDNPDGGAYVQAWIWIADPPQDIDEADEAIEQNAEE